MYHTIAHSYVGHCPVQYNVEAMVSNCVHGMLCTASSAYGTMNCF